MKIILRYTPEAKRDLAAVWKGVWFASRNFDTADHYVNDLQMKIEEKKLFPLSGIPLYYGKRFTGFYSINFKAYKAFYRVNDEFMEVLRILPIKMDYMKILFGAEDLY